VAGITPLNNFLGPESDPVTAVTQLPKYQSDHIMGFGSRLGESPNTWKHFGPELTQEQYSVLL